MSGDGLIVGVATQGNAAAVAAIYAHHVRTGTATFDTDPPSEEYWRDRITDIIARGWPMLVAVRGDAVLGYAYATQFRDRPAYARTCENSIYVHPDALAQGVGSVLMASLIDASASAGFREMIAVIGGGEPASVALHSKCGFRHAGRMENVGMKFGRLLDTIYMQRGLGETQ